MEFANDLSGKETDERDQMGSKDLATGVSAAFPPGACGTHLCQVA